MLKNITTGLKSLTCKFMHDLYIAEINRPGTIFLLLTSMSLS